MDHFHRNYERASPNSRVSFMHHFHSNDERAGFNKHASPVNHIHSNDEHAACNRYLPVTSVIMSCGSGGSEGHCMVEQHC